MAKNDEPLYEKSVRFIKENFSLIVLPIIAILVLATGIYLYSKQKAQLSVQDIANIIAQREESEVSEATKEKEETAIEETGVKEPKLDNQVAVTETLKPETGPNKVEATQKLYSYVAKKGEGTTHLARYAIKDYLLNDATGKTLKDKLTPEHKVYAEDYVKDIINKSSLKIGEKLTFSPDLIKEAVNKSLGLNDKQLANLKQFTNKIVSFNLNY